MKSGKLPVSILILIIFSILIIGDLFAGTVSKLSNVFTLDTRTEELPPVNGWQILTSKGDTYNEDLIIDNYGKVWCFYFRSPGANQPVYLKIFKSDGYVYKSEQIVGYSSSNAESKYNSIRAAENDSTGDVWVAIQGSQGGYFVIFDSTGTVKKDSTLLAQSAFSPKIAQDKNGKMWFCWHNQMEPNPDSEGKISRYSANGERELDPVTIGRHTYLFNTDLAVDDSNRIWVVFEINQNGDYATKFSIYNSDISIYLDGKIAANNSAPINPQRQIYSDVINQKMWILEKNTTIAQQQLHIYALDGSSVSTIENVGDCGFVRNEKNFLEVIHFNDQNIENKIYESRLYLAQTGNFYSSETKFDSTYQFVRNGIAYNSNHKTLKSYAVQFDSNSTKIKFEQVSPGYPEISVKSINFDTTKISPNYVKQRNVNVQNLGSAILEVYNIIPHDPHFTVGNTTFQLLPGQSTNIPVNFTPTDEDSIVDYILFLSNDPTNDSLKVAVSAKGHYPTNPLITVDEDALIFDSIIIGNTQTKSIYVYNNDLYEPLKIYSIRSSNSQFTTGDTAGFSLNPQKGKYVSINFKPIEVGEITGLLTINSNDTTHSSLNIPLKGTGIRYGTPKIVISPDTLDFGNVATGYQKSLYLEIENTGDTNLEIYNITTADTQYSANIKNFIIAPYSTYYVLITYQVTRMGNANTIMTINSSDLSIPNYYLPVKGNGREALAPQISVSQDTLNFGTIPIGNLKTAYFWISNLGEDPLYIQSIQSNNEIYNAYPSSFMVNAGYPRSIAVTFSPDEPDTSKGMLTIVSNDANNDTSYLYLSGIGRSLTPPQMVLSTERIDFGQIATTQSLTRAFTIHNSGEQLLEVTQIEISEANPSFSVSPGSMDVPSGQYRSVSVTFSPKQLGEISGTVNITSNNPPSQTVSLFGSGREPAPQNIYVNRTQIAFDSVAISKSKSIYIWIRNTGEKELTVQNITTADSSFTVNFNSFKLNPGQSQNVLLTFTPTMQKFYEDNLVIQSDDPDNQYQNIALTGYGRQLKNQNIQLSSNSLFFGEVAVSQQKVFGLIVYNTGEKDLSISNIVNNKSNFSVDNRQFVVSPQSHHSIYITFTPQALTSYLDTLKIINDDPETPLIQVPLSGSGRELMDQKIAVFSDSVHFGSIGVGLSSDQNIQIRNEGEVNLKIDSIKISTKYFVLRSDNSFSIGPGLSNWISITFQPDSVGEFEATLTIYSNDPVTPEFTAPLVGSGRQLLDPNITFNPNNFNFGEVAVGRSKSLQLYIGNDGEKELAVNSITSNNGQFTIDKTSFTIEPGNSQILTITFQPTEMDTIQAQLTVISNDPDSSIAILPLKGTGRALKEPQLAFTPEELNFGTVEMGDSLSKNLTIQNLGDLSLLLYSIASSDTHFVVTVDSISIEEGQSYNLKVTFSPDDTLEIQATMEIKSNDPNNYILYVPLRGKGHAQVQQIVVSPTYLDFKDVKIHSSSTRYLSVSNIDVRPLTISNILSDNSHFHPQLTNFTVEQNENKQVPVSFTPDSIKIFNGKLTIVSDDPVANKLVVSVTGVGRDSLDQKIAVSPDSLYFDQVALNNIKTLYVTVKNTGEKYLKISNIVSTNSVFKTNMTKFQIAPQGLQSVNISFTPTFSKTYKDTLKIISNDPDFDTVLVKLAGIGREPVPQQIAVSDTALNFGTVPTDRLKSLSFTLQNIGERNLEISQLAISNNQFSVSEKWLVIEPGQIYHLIVTFSPRQSGLVNANLTIQSNDPKKPSTVVKLKGSGVFYNGPKISIHPESVNFGNVLIGATKKMSFWIVNSSKDSTLRIDSFSLLNDAFSISTTNLTIRPGDSSAVPVQFKPYTSGEHYAQGTIHSNDAYQRILDFWIYGNGVMENSGENHLANLGWKSDGYTPVGDFFSPNPRTDSLLSDAPDRAWFIKDIYLATQPQNAWMNLCFDDEILLFINSSFILADTSNQPLYWNISNQSIKPYLKLGRNRIAIMVWNKQALQGGFDCELVVDGESKIRRGDQNWTNPDATWWYFGGMGQEYPTPPLDSPYNRLWFHGDYGLAGIDTVESSWAFEPTGSDTIYDNSPYGQVAILHNVTWIKGIIGQAMQFSGLPNSYVELHANINKIPQFIELWLNCYGAKPHAQNVITNKGNASFGQGLFIDENMRLGVYYYNGEFITKFTVNPNTWYFVSTQYKSDKIFVYVNNSLADSISYSQGNPVGSNICYLAGNPLQTDSITAFYGAIDELKIRTTDTQPAEMQEVAKIAVVPVDSSSKGINVNLDFNIYPTPYKILSGTFEYTWGGSEIYRTRSLSYRDSTFNSDFKIAIPADSTTVRGLKYRISLQTDYGEVKYPENSTDFSWIEVKTSRETSAVVLPQKIHRMISVPYNLDDPSIDAVLVDNFGIKDPYSWRLFDWNQADTNYIAYDDSTWLNRGNFTRGKAFWLISSQSKTYDAGAGRSPGNENYRINLNPGWNMIGDPFPYPVSWSDIEKTSSQISDPIYRSTADSIGWIYYVQTINPWEGYFVWNGDNSNRSLIVPPKEAPVRPLNKKTLASKFLSKYPEVSVLISADLRCGKYMDCDNLFGIAENAADEYDNYDLKEAPAIGDYISLWIDNRNWKKFNGAYTVDIRSGGSDGCAWDIVVDCSLEKPEGLLTMKFQQQTNLPDNWLMYLFDSSEDIAINLKDRSEISFNPVAAKHTLKHYKLVIGTEAFVLQNSDEIPLVPLEFELFQNYPNPFNAATTISFNLPSRMQVSVKIYNILGQLVKTVIDEEIRGGNHKIYWDGRNNQGNMISTGVYIIRMQSKNKVAVKKLLMIK